jgi:hypothetical protein
MRFLGGSGLAVILVLTCATPCFADYASEVSADNPMAWWRFEDASSSSGSSAYDTAGPYNGTYSGDVELRAGISGRAARFDGSSDSVDIGNMGPLPPRGTIEFWMYPEVVESYRNPLTTGPLTGGTSGNHAIRLEESTGGLFRLYVGDNTGIPPDYSGNLTFDLVADRWYHVVVTWDTSLGVVNAFLDGELVIDGDSNAFWPPEINNMTIGMGFQDHPDRCWLGRVDEVAVYDTSLSADRVAAHYGAALPAYARTILDDQPFAWWRFEDASSATSDPASDFIGAHDGLYSGDIVLEPGIAGGSARFDGDLDMVTIGNIGGLPAAGSFELWILPDAVENYRAAMTTAPLGGSSTGNRGFRFESYNSGSLILAIGDDTATTSPQFTATVTPSLEEGGWSHIVVSWDTSGGLVNGYLNGEHVIVDAANSNWPSMLSDVTIGIGWGSYTDRSFEGLIDEVAFYDTPLAEERVRAHFNGPYLVFADGFESGDTTAWN